MQRYMRYIRYMVFTITAVLIVLIESCAADNSIPADEQELLMELRNEIIDDLENNLLPFWKNNSVDHDDPNKGFFGAISNEGTGIHYAKKGSVLFARYLWTYSAAYRVLGDDESLELAHRAYRYFTDHFIDHEFGGVYWELNHDGTVSDPEKITYGLSFAVYALSEYFRVTQDPESLDHAVQLYNMIEKHARDSEFGGYLEAFTREWEYIEGGGSVAAGQAKSMNTHLHILEAYTNLFRVWPDKNLKESIYDLADIFNNHIVDKSRYHQDLYFSSNWEVYGDYDSYGHDIEFSWLFYEAAEVLEDKEFIKEAGELAVKIASAQMEKGLNPDGAMIYERAGENEYVTNIDWWVQAEAVVGFLNAYDISGDMVFLEAAAGVWEYINKNMIDRQYGGWFPRVDERGNPAPGRVKANAWTGPYHNVRMGLEVYHRYMSF